MCNIAADKRWTTARKGFSFYKLVTPKSRKSPIYPHKRSLSEGTMSRGVVLTYAKGATVVSPDGPGIMGYASRAETVERHKNRTNPSARRMVRLFVRKGWRYRTGQEGHWGLKLIAAERVVVRS